MQAKPHHRIWTLTACLLSLALVSPPLAAQSPFDSFSRDKMSKTDQMEARLLTASCAACHGTNGYSVGITPVLAGIGLDHFVRQMNDFKSGARPGTVMNRHARGYTYAEIEIMGMFFSSKKRHDCPPTEK